MVKPGFYKATVLSHAITETRSGDPQAVISFSFEADGSAHILTWYGSFKEKAQPITIKALVICGLKGNNPAGELETGKEVSITVDIEKDENGKDRNKIKWINPVGLRNVIPRDMAKEKLKQLEGAVMMARHKIGALDGDEEIPF